MSFARIYNFSSKLELFFLGLIAIFLILRAIHPVSPPTPFATLINEPFLALFSFP